jgi:hypothetical protein
MMKTDFWQDGPDMRSIQKYIARVEKEGISR